MAKIKLKNRKALVVYNKTDFDKNKHFAQALVDELNKKKLVGHILLLDDETADHKHIKNVELIINRSRRINFLTKHNFLNSFLINPQNIVLVANDKYETYRWLKQHKFLTVDTTIFDPKKIKTFPIVIKKRDSHGGEDVHLIQNAEEIKQLPIQNPNEWIVQPFLSIGKVEYRAYILFGKVLKTIRRTASGDDFRANYSQNAAVDLFKLKWYMKHKIKRIAKKLGHGYYAIDFFLNKYNRIVVNEIEDAAGARALTKMCPDLNLPRVIIKSSLTHFKHHLKRQMIP